MGNWETRLREWQNLDVPEGWRAEITPAGVTLTPPVDNGHSRIAASVHRTLVRSVPEDRAILQKLGVSIRSASRLYVPGLVVVPHHELLSRPDNVPVPAEAAELVVEIYLLIDRYAEPKPSVTLFSDPVDGHYRRSEQVSFGEEIRLPAPFDLVLATAAF
ncbi:PDDEXK family nuclease [Amycolatopsis thermoflava]|uniref:hypothetical protein n=1 Tax=Amycolatopsis thermoflava TaxID=84480 RepID=UPI00040B1958|nr:hypothetical protein [Amycolatopsis thermoflava]